MEAQAPLSMLEKGNALQNRKSICFRVAFHALTVLLIIISALVSIIFCLLHHKQAQGPCCAHGSLNQSSTQNSSVMSWNWKLDHCNGIVQDQVQYLIIEQSGNYLISAQLYRQKKIREILSLTLFKDPGNMLINAVGDGNGTVSFARPIFLEKGDKLYCKKNDILANVMVENQTYWGLCKM